MIPFNSVILVYNLRWEAVLITPISVKPTTDNVSTKIYSFAKIESLNKLKLQTKKSPLPNQSTLY